jgi:hypothetical protein
LERICYFFVARPGWSALGELDGFGTPFVAMADDLAESVVA